MKKQEVITVALLIITLLAWLQVNRSGKRPVARENLERPAATNAASADAFAAATGAPPSTPSIEAPEPDGEALAAVEGQPDVQDSEDEDRLAGEAGPPVVLTNGAVEVAVSPLGGAVVEVRLREYRSTVDRGSPPLTLDFGARPALSLAGVPGLSTNCGFAVSRVDGGLAVTRTTVRGIRFERSIRLREDHRLQVRDVFTNERGEAVTLPSHRVALGTMRNLETVTKSGKGNMPYLGIDTLPEQAGERVKHWGGELPSLFGYRRPLLGCVGARDVGPLPERIERRMDYPVTWVAVKNKFFVQILEPERGGADCELLAARDPAERRAVVIASVAADMVFPAAELAPGSSLAHEMNYYVGPKKYTVVSRFGNNQDTVMQFGWWGWYRWLCSALLWTLNALHDQIPNYGVAILLLTLFVRLIFWPVTHKSGQSMRKMQQLQPLIAELRKKHPNSPQKLQQETMALYREHKVNPMAGCLPMLIQMPVFIALFTVLRSAVELRFAEFLWIRDLSEPEGIVVAGLPIAMNILPILMTVTMIWQQKLTPAAGDPQQQKMMMFMPIIMLAVFYNMASALVLYWTFSQCLSIAGLLWQRQRASRSGAIAATPRPA